MLSVENYRAGQTGTGVREVGVMAKQTTPPKPYDEGGLLADMKSAAKFIPDAGMREALKEADGIGTPATRAAIIEGLKEKGYLKLEKGLIRSTPDGEAIIKALPEKLTNPGTTAVWEEMLSRIAKGTTTPVMFMTQIEKTVQELLAIADATKISTSAGGGGAGDIKPLKSPCPKCGGEVTAGDKSVRCSKGCGFQIWREVSHKKIPDAELEKLLASGKTGKIEGFVSAKTKKKFSARLKLNAAENKLEFEFDERKAA